MGACACGSSSEYLLIGSPTAALCLPGHCVFKEDKSSAKLVERVNVTHNTILLTFALPDPLKPLGLSTCACILASFYDQQSGEVVVRPYTPVSTNALKGKFQLCVKVYDKGKMSQHLNTLPIGSSVQFKHIPVNVKVQYPFNRAHVTMLAGGTGITPMIQALHAILGTETDATQVSVICGNKTQDDILLYELLKRWAKGSAGRLQVTHVLSKGAEDLSWHGLEGHISRDIIGHYSVPPSKDVLVMVCGPSAMYDTLCGPRDKKELTGLLNDMGFSTEQVYKM